MIAKSYPSRSEAQAQYTDRDTTSQNGAWELRFKAYLGGHTTFKVTPKKIGRRYLPVGHGVPRARGLSRR